MKTCLKVVGLCLLLAAFAAANTITGTCTGISGVMGTYSPSPTVTCAGFPTSTLAIPPGYTLVSLTLTISGSVQGFWSLSSPGGTINYTVSGTDDVNLGAMTGFGGLPTALLNAPATGPLTGTLGTGQTASGTVPLTNGLMNFTTSGAVSATYLNPPNGTFNIPVNLVAGINGSSNGGIIFVSQGTFGVNASYSFVYEPSGIPEPATMSLLGAGLLGLGLMARRLQRKR